MSILGIVNSDPVVGTLIEASFAIPEKTKYDLKFLTAKDDIIEFLNYELPEIVVINFSDSDILIDEIMSQIEGDKWLANFGIVGIFSQNRDNEESILAKYKAINILTLMEKNRIRSHLVKNIQILEKNYQIIFQREFSKDLLYGISGTFTLRNDILAVPIYAGIGATILSQRGYINPDSKMHLQLALDELLVNAIEHGNCKISYDEKTKAMEAGRSVVDLVAEKNRNLEIRAKKVEFQWEIQKEMSVFSIEDEGDGFDVNAHMKKLKVNDLESLHGRGIRLAKALSSQLIYNSKGNKVSLIIKHDPSVEHEVPLGFSQERVVTVKRGDIVLRENEPSDYLYYIASGTYTVHHKQKQVGVLGPQDIFMGEMSFLLGQRRSASVRADSSGKLILLTRKAFINIIRKYPHYGIFLSKLLAKRLVRGNEQIATMAKKIEKPAAPLPKQ